MTSRPTRPCGSSWSRRATVAPAFALSRQNATAVAAICRRLDGLPLALELAAARVRTLSPTELLARLDRALPLLSGGARDLPARQRTMRATITWSYQLLKEPEGRLLDRLSVFTDGWSLAAAEAVGTGAGIVEEDVLDLLTGLVEQSLVQVETDEDRATRYRISVPVREYAAERLQQRGAAEATWRRHAAYFLALAETAEPELRGPRQVAWLERLELEQGNLRAALRSALAAGDAATAARLAAALSLFWWLRGHQDEGRRWMDLLLARDLPRELRITTLTVAGEMAYTEGDYPACEAACREAVALAEQGRDGRRAGRARMGLGLVAMHGGDDVSAAAHFEAVLLAARESGDDALASTASTQLGTVWRLRGNLTQAVARYEDALALARRLGDRGTAYVALYNLALVAQARGDWATATSCFSEGARLSLETRDRAHMAHCLEGLAVVAGVRGQAERAARLLGNGRRAAHRGGGSGVPLLPARSLPLRACHR